MKMTNRHDDGRPSRFTVVATEVPGKPGTWSSNRVEVFDQGAKVGEYMRNYGMAEQTFAPFEMDGRWYALYSKDYTATRLMSLPDCRDLGGEEFDPCGFCPVEFFVPCYRLLTYDILSDRRDGEKVENHLSVGERILWPGTQDAAYWTEKVADAVPEEPKLHTICNPRISGLTFCPFALVSGCVWGDDTSLKVEFIDLSGAGSGRIARDDRFGYLELSPSLTLAESVHLYCWSPDNPVLSLSHATDFDLRRRVADNDPRTGPLPGHTHGARS